MVENVEGFSAELQAHTFSQAKVLQQREVEILEGWSNQNVATGVAKEVQRIGGIDHVTGIAKCRRIEEQARRNILIGIADDVGTLLTDVGRVVLRREGTARKHRDDAVDLVVAKQSLFQTAGIVEECFAATKR